MLPPMEGRYFPIAGIVIALATGGVMIQAGTNPWLVAAATLVWVGSFWLAIPPPAPEPAPQPLEGVQLTRTGMRDLLEHSGLPMLMLDGNRIIVANAAAREAIGAHILGQDARVAFRHPAAVDLLSRAEGGSASIQGLTGPRSSWQMTRHRTGRPHHRGRRQPRAHRFRRQCQP
jgi:two-component system phosphate regulon sensor histidine kinase PhoR